MKQRPATLRVAVQAAAFIEAGERRRIWRPFVEVVDRLRGAGRRPLGRVAPVHPNASPARTSETKSARARLLVSRGALQHLDVAIGRFDQGEWGAPVARPT